MRRTLLLLRALVEYARTSIFLVPLGFIAGATGLAWLTTALDRRIGERGEVPPLLVSTVESARALLSTVAGATLTFAAISISISLLLTQMATSQFSPRVAYSYFRDPATRWGLGVVVGTSGSSTTPLGRWGSRRSSTASPRPPARRWPSAAHRWGSGRRRR